MRLFKFPMLSARFRTVLPVAVAGGAVLLAGCGGGGGSNSGNSANLRAIDAVSNGGTATVSVNSSSLGNQGYFGVTSYQSKGSGTTSLGFSLSANSGTAYPVVTQNFLIGSYYSLVLMGRADITATGDPRYPTLVAVQDTFTTPFSSQAGLRVVHAAPDAGPVDVLVNGSIITSSAAYKSVSTLFSEPSGSVTIQINQGGTGTALVGVQTLSLNAGHVYTIYVVEPTVSDTPAYGIQESDDTAAVQ